MEYNILMKRLIILALMLVPISLGCSGNLEVTAVCDGTPPVRGKFIDAGVAGFYIVEVNNVQYYIPVQRCVLIRNGQPIDQKEVK
jgi:hypothetical protein